MTTFAPWHWAVLAGLLLLLEVATPGFVFAWLALGGLVLAAVAWIVPTLIWQVQIVLFVLISGAAVLIWFRFRPVPEPPAEPGLNRRAYALIGTRLTLDDPIVDGRGRARLGDGSWPITGPDLPAGSTVEVVAVDGTRLVVARATA